MSATYPLLASILQYYNTTYYILILLQSTILINILILTSTITIQKSMHLASMHTK